jgi:hypothetical protein
LKSTGLESASSPWETVGMAKDDKYIPKINDPVFVKGKGLIRYVAAVVDTKRKTVDVRTVLGCHRSYPRRAVVRASDLDESQNAVRVVREATED